MALLEVRNLSTRFRTAAGDVRAVEDVSFDVDRGETLCLVGESGSGKSVTALSMLRLLQSPPAYHAGGEIVFDGRDLLQANESTMRRVRGGDISMIFQEPLTSLNPVMRVGRQIVEAIRTHQHVSRAEAAGRAVELLTDVGIPDPERRLREYPHQFSGGMRQRVMIAMALACTPKLLIADEPTTALDTTVQAQILDLLRGLQAKYGTAILLITHDMGVVAQMAHRVAVMYAGRIVEQGTTDEIFTDPLMPYTWSLLRSVPRLDDAGKRLFSISGTPPGGLRIPPGCPFHPRCPVATDECAEGVPPLRERTPGHLAACIREADEFRAARERLAAQVAPAEPGAPRRDDAGTLLALRDLHKVYTVNGSGLAKRRVKAVNGVDLDVRPGETLGIVGESGCGKSTLAQLVVRLVDPTAGTATYDGRDLAHLRGGDLRRQRKDIQMVFQDPFASLDPRLRVRDILAEPLTSHRYDGVVPDRVGELLSLVGLDPRDAHKFPHEFSGGQRQRIAIARAIANNPRLVVLDEPVSALDVSVRAQVLNLLRDLQHEFGLTYVLITHDLAVVRSVCTRVAVMYLGQVVELAPTEQLFAHRRHPYTGALLSAIPIPDPAVERTRERVLLRGDVPSPANLPSGCLFHTRCPRAQDRCRHEQPELVPLDGPAHLGRCHFPVRDGEPVALAEPRTVEA
ncbi:MAG TPA: ABC transporter ATP-binding protein [Streptosporangiales bacterium]